jgi:hypothetical protein
MIILVWRDAGAMGADHLDPCFHRLSAGIAEKAPLQTGDPSQFLG